MSLMECAPELERVFVQDLQGRGCLGMCRGTSYIADWHST